MKKIISLVLAIISLISVISCSRRELLIEEEKMETDTVEENKTEAPVYTKKHKPLGEFEVDFDNPNFDPFDKKQIREKMPFTQFENEIKNYEKAPIEKGKIIFYGASGFTRWSERYGNIPLEESIPGTLNHGFGGSCMHQLCYYYDRMIKPYEPKAIVLSFYGNDNAAGYTNTEMMKLVGWFYNQAIKDFPDIRIYILDIRPGAVKRSESEIKQRFEMNDMLKKYSEKHSNFIVLEASKQAFFYTDPKYAGTMKNIDASIYLEDQRHLNARGYALMTEYMKESLAEIL